MPAVERALSDDDEANQARSESDRSSTDAKAEPPTTTTMTTTAAPTRIEPMPSPRSWKGLVARTLSAPVMRKEGAALASPPTSPPPTGPGTAATTTATARRLSVADIIRSFSPRSRGKKAIEPPTLRPTVATAAPLTPAAATDNSPTTTAAPSGASVPLTTFGKLKRSSLSAKRQQSQQQQQQQLDEPTTTVKRPDSDINNKGKAPPPQQQQTRPTLAAVARDAARLRVEIPSGPPKNPDEGDNDATGHDFVDEVRETFDKLLRQLDGIDPRKLSAIRLGGELRGLLGKAQDEFLAYEDAFVAHAAKVGVAIALQNLAASLHQVFPIVERLQTAKFLLNRQFKRQVTFAFQEINSYYTSLFMELSMAVASQGAIVPVPSPIKAPVVLDVEPVRPVPAPEPPVPLPRPPPPASTGAEICVAAHQAFFGHGRAVDRPRALELYQDAANLGDTTAACCLGHMYMTGEGVSRDVFIAEKWLGHAASAGDVEASYLLGCLLCDKAKTQRTDSLQRCELLKSAIMQLTIAADRGHREGQFRLGQLYELGEAHAPHAADSVRAMQWYRRAAEQQHTLAEAAVGRLLCTSSSTSSSSDNGITRDVTQAMHFLQRAATKGDPLALTLLGSILFEGDGVKRDCERARAMLERAAGLGEHQAMYRLGFLLRETISTNPLDPQFAIPHQDLETIHDELLRLWLNAAHGGILDAWYQLGKLLEDSRWIHDAAAARRYYRRAAEASPPHAQAARRVAEMYYGGIGGPVDKRKAHEFYAIAANVGGDAVALNALGLMFEEGDGCDLDFQKAATSFRRAIELGSAHAYFNLGCLLSSGKGVPRNLEAAHAHFQKAYQLGYVLAQDFVTTLSSPAAIR